MIRIMLDAGHGKSTPGKRSPDDKLLEYKFNRQMVKIVANELNKYKEIEVLYTQPPEEDYDLSTSGRVKHANKEDVDYFISIHANAYDTYERIIKRCSDGTEEIVNGKRTFNSAKGFEIYVISKGGKAEKLANSILCEVGNDIEGIKIRGLKVANFVVLKDTNMPAILIESGFMTNEEECKKLLSENYRNLLGKAYVKGIIKHIGIPLIKTEMEKEKIYKVQVGAYKDYKNALKTQNELKNKGYDAYIAEEEV